ncbi:MAG TPA: ABC transporter substrate-binding protein [Methylomirabilota bacterium]|jgi:putative ABC transport system substrate-binding protein|nr:ABC transporter substrate-binding protein [Methylomirabilota bacterium]
MGHARRVLAAVVAAALLGLPLRSLDAQMPAGMARVGVLASTSPTVFEPLRRGLEELGWTPGRNLAFEIRAAEGQLDRLPGLAAELAQARVDLIVAPAPPHVRAALDATRTIPVVFFAVADPVGMGFAASLARPGGNATGVASSVPEGFLGKLLELLREAVPQARRVAVFTNPANPQHYCGVDVPELTAPATALGLTLQFVEVRTIDMVEVAFAAAVRGRAEAAVVCGDPVIFAARARVAELATRHRLPTIFPTREYLGGRGLMSHGPSLAELARQAARYVDRILRGAKPADLPIEQPRKYELVVNLQAARALQLTLPASLLSRADHVIE